jgi:GTP-binding protein Era
MAQTEINEGHRSGFVAVAGRPNVGKSTLINAFLGQTIAAVSPRPQTTRRRQLGILTLPTAQVIFVDTPGIHKSRHKLDDQMNAQAIKSIQDADLLLVIFDLNRPPNENDKRVAERVLSLSATFPILAVLNKIDLVPPDEILDRQATFSALLPSVDMYAISSTRGDNREQLLQRIVDLLPFGPRYFPDNEVTDTYERDIAANFIRAACLNLLHDEVPHCIAVRMDEYKERGEHGAYIAATLFVERDSQKGIVIGKGGAILREIGIQARKEIETMSGRKVYLELKVKVLPGWRNDLKAIKRLGLGTIRR